MEGTRASRGGSRLRNGALLIQGGRWLAVAPGRGEASKPAFINQRPALNCRFTLPNNDQKDQLFSGARTGTPRTFNDDSTRRTPAIDRGQTHLYSGKTKEERAGTEVPAR
jgi:hypothetical protein